MASKSNKRNRQDQPGGRKMPEQASQQARQSGASEKGQGGMSSSRPSPSQFPEGGKGQGPFPGPLGEQGMISNRGPGTSGDLDQDETERGGTNAGRSSSRTNEKNK